MAGDVFVTVSLAGTLFFDVAVGAARPKVVQYLLITMTPFVLVAPVLGPALDRTRGGRRVLFAVAMLARAVLCLAMAPRVDSLMLYPLAFALLVCSKGQAVAKSALVPAVVTDHEALVTANSRLAIIGVAAGAVTAPVAAGVFTLFGPDWVLRLGAVVLLAGGLSAFRIPRAAQVAPAETAHEREVLHAPSIVRAGSAMAVWRGIVGFFTFFAAFALKQAAAPAWTFGAVIVSSAIGNAVGTVVAPALRRRFREEWILSGALLVPALPLVFAARAYGRPALMLAAASVAAAAACGRVAFDSLLQRDGAEAARGRAFARFETRFQLAWVAGGLLAVLFPGGGRSGIFLVALVLLFAGLSYANATRVAAGPAGPLPEVPQ